MSAKPQDLLTASSAQTEPLPDERFDLSTGEVVGDAVIIQKSAAIARREAGLLAVWRPVVQSVDGGNALDRTDGIAGSGLVVYRVSPHLAWYGSDNRAHAQACKAAPPLCELPRRPAKPKLDSALREIASA